MTRVILNLISGTYANAEILLTWHTEDKNTFPCCYCHVLEPHVDKYETWKSLYFLKDSIDMMLYLCCIVLEISSEELP